MRRAGPFGPDTQSSEFASNAVVNPPRSLPLHGANTRADGPNRSAGAGRARGPRHAAARRHDHAAARAHEHARDARAQNIAAARRARDRHRDRSDRAEQFGDAHGAQLHHRCARAHVAAAPEMPPRASEPARRASRARRALGFDSRARSHARVARAGVGHAATGYFGVKNRDRSLLFLFCGCGLVWAVMWAILALICLVYVMMGGEAIILLQARSPPCARPLCPVSRPLGPVRSHTHTHTHTHTSRPHRHRRRLSSRCCTRRCTASSTPSASSCARTASSCTAIARRA